MNQYGRQGARRSLIHTAGFRLLSQAATALSYVLLVRGMSEHDFGVLSLLYAIIPVVSTVASLGLEQTLRRYQPEYLREGNVGRAFWLVRVVAFMRLTTNLVVLAVLLGLWNLIAPIFQLGDYRAQFELFAFLIILHFQARILQLSLASHMLHKYSVGSMAMLPVVKIVVYAGLMWFDIFTLRFAILADMLAYLTAYLFLTSAYRRMCLPPAGASTGNPGRTELRRLFKYGLFNNFNDAGVFLLGVRSDNFFIAALMNPVAVGAYAFYTRLNEMVGNLSPLRFFDNVIQPLFFSIPAEEAKRRIPRYFTLILNMNLPPQLAVLTYAVAYHHEIVAVLFGGKFIESSSLLPLVVGFATLNSIATPVTLAAQHAEKVSVVLLSKITVVYQVAATLLLIPIAGLYGAAIATGTAEFLKNLFIWWHVRATARWTNLRDVLTYGILIWGATAAACLILKRVIPLPPIAHLAIGVVLIGVAALIYIRTPAISSGDREILDGVLKDRERRILTRIGFAIGRR